MINVADPFETNNNSGFNLANFKAKFLQDFYQDVASDYDRSFIGSFASSLLKMVNKAEYEVYFSICKFENQCGFSMTKNTDTF